MKKLILILCLLLLAQPCWPAVDFDEADDSIATSNTDIFDIEANYTISVWANLDDAGDLGLAAILAKVTVAGGIDFIFHYDSNRALFIYDNSTATNANSVNAAFAFDTWVHIVVTNNSGTINFYVNTVDKSSDTSLTESDPGAGVCVIGAEDNLAFQAYEMDGALAELAVWTIVLTADEIAQLYNSKIIGIPLQIQPASLVMYYPLDDLAHGSAGGGATFKDMTQNGYGTGNNDGSGLVGVTAPGLSYP